MARDSQGLAGADQAANSGSVFRRRFITLRAEHSSEELDLELPADRTVADLLPEIVRALGWPGEQAGHSIQYQLLNEAGELISEAGNLIEAGVENSDVLWIQMTGLPSVPTPPEDRSSDAVAAPKRRQAVPLGLDSTAGAPERKGSLPPPVETGVEILKPSMASREGIVFELGEARTLVGRSGRGFQPDIDLTDLDPEYAASRRHALLEAQNEGIVITALVTTNGTFLNGAELAPGSKQVLSDGDEIQFGVEGVKLTFLTEGQILPSSFFQ